MIKYKLIVLSILLFIAMQKMTAQFPELFIGKVDKNIKEVSCYIVDNKGDSSDVEYVFNFDQHGFLVREAQPNYYVEVNYTYDKQGRVSEKDAVYGESFANGTTSYSYAKDTTIVKNMAMGFYSETRTIMNNLGQTAKVESYFVAGGMGESKIELEQFTYNKNQLPDSKQITITFFDFNKEIGEIQESEPADLLSALKMSPISKSESYIVNYQYDDKKQLETEILSVMNTKEKIWEINYVYNKASLLISKIKTCQQTDNQKFSITCNASSVIKKYDADNQLIGVVNTESGHTIQQFYSQGKLIKDIEEYNGTDEVSHIYRYKYY